MAVGEAFNPSALPYVAWALPSLRSAFDKVASKRACWENCRADRATTKQWCV